MNFDPDRRPLSDVSEPVTALVTGASSGIGLAMVDQLLRNRHVDRVVAVSRSADSSPSLQALRDREGERLHCIAADLSDDAGLCAVVDGLNGTQALHLVVHAAGALHGDGFAPEKAVAQVRRVSLERVFAINAFAPLLLAQALLPLLCRGRPAVFASLSARVGSIGDNRAGGWYAYRASKAAQNQLMRTFSIEWRWRNPQGRCLSLHPGTVDTPLSAPFQAGVPEGRLFEPARAASQLLDVIARSTPADSGRFLAWDGAEIPW